MAYRIFPVFFLLIHCVTCLGIDGSHPINKCPFPNLLTSDLADLRIFKRVYAEAVLKSNEWHQGKDWLPGRPYSDHYEQVENVLNEFGYRVDSVQGRSLHIGARLHDVMEDSKTTQTELENHFGKALGSLVAAVTNVVPADINNPELVKLAKLKTLENIRRHSDATILKLADRIANMRSYHSSGISPKHYLSEYPLFKKTLYRPGEAEAMWTELDRLTENSEVLAN